MPVANVVLGEEADCKRHTGRYVVIMYVLAACRHANGPYSVDV